MVFLAGELVGKGKVVEAPSGKQRKASNAARRGVDILQCAHGESSTLYKSEVVRSVVDQRGQCGIVGAKGVHGTVICAVKMRKLRPRKGM